MQYACGRLSRRNRNGAQLDSRIVRLVEKPQVRNVYATFVVELDVLD